MNKNITVGIIIIILILLTVGSFFIFPKINEAGIKSAIAEANYCTTDSECVDAGGKCPFDCYVYVNENEVDRISSLIDSYNSRCVYSCIQNKGSICENNKCKAIYE